MVNQKWVAISYCCAFLSIYFFYIAYSIIAISINKSYEAEILPEAKVMNATTYALSSFSVWSGISFSIMVIIAVIIIIFLIINSVRSMGMAYSN